MQLGALGLGEMQAELGKLSSSDRSALTRPENRGKTEWSEAMRGRPFTLTWSADDSEEALKAAYLAERDGVIRTRLQALWRLCAGRSLTEVTAAVGMYYRTVQRWVEWYRDGGLAQVRSRRMGGWAVAYAFRDRSIHRPTPTSKMPGKQGGSGRRSPPTA